jgi:hypothetical protein
MINYFEISKSTQNQLKINSKSTQNQLKINLIINLSTHYQLINPLSTHIYRNQPKIKTLSTRYQSQHIMPLGQYVRKVE